MDVAKETKILPWHLDTCGFFLQARSDRLLHGTAVSDFSRRRVQDKPGKKVRSAMALHRGGDGRNLVAVEFSVP